MKPTVEQSDFIEHMGRWWEVGTGSRSAGRILGWLMICQPVHQSAADLVAALSISTGSVSTQIRFLEELQFVERITFPGDRSTYFQLRPDVWLHVMGTEPDHLKRMMAISEAGADVVPEERPERVTDIGLIAGFMLGKWPSFMEELRDHIEKERQND